MSLFEHKRDGSREVTTLLFVIISRVRTGWLRNRKIFQNPYLTFPAKLVPTETNNDEPAGESEYEQSRWPPHGGRPTCRRRGPSSRCTSEASPWCRLVRKHTTILGLAMRIRPCPRQTLFLEGAFDVSSRFRPEAMTHLKRYCDTDELTFPLLVDETDAGGTTDPTVVHHSYDILASVGKIRSGCQSRRRAATGPTLEFRPDSLSAEIHFPRGAVLPSGVAHLWDPSISIPVDGPRQR